MSVKRAGEAAAARRPAPAAADGAPQPLPDGPIVCLDPRHPQVTRGASRAVQEAPVAPPAAEPLSDLVYAQLVAIRDRLMGK
jgi:hypothetical protein